MKNNLSIYLINIETRKENIMSLYHTLINIQQSKSIIH